MTTGMYESMADEQVLWNVSGDQVAVVLSSRWLFSARHLADYM